MQVRLTTIVETIIDTEENSPNFEEAKREIFSRYSENPSLEDTVEDLQAHQSNAVVYDTVVTSKVTHSFEKVQ